MAIFQFDHRSQPTASNAVFIGRVAVNILTALGLIGAALAAGMVGYRLTEQMSWLDAFLNASMLLGGMGPVDVLHTDAGKLFAGLYALACGLIFVLASGVVLAPVFHRVFHAIHVDADKD